MTCADVLRAAGWPLGQHGRTTCPIHQGDNPQSFAYDFRRWKCHACGAWGSPEDLARTLLEPATAIEGLGIAQPPTPRLSEAVRRSGRAWAWHLTRFALAAIQAEWLEAIEDADAARHLGRVAARQLPTTWEGLDEVVDTLAVAYRALEEGIARATRLDAEMSRFRDLTRGGRSG